MKRKALFFWSGGKDSALSLYKILAKDEYDVSALVTTVTADSERVGMHGLRSGLLDTQAESIGLPLEKVYVPKNAGNDTYEAALREVLLNYRKTGVNTAVYGDIYLQDIRKYRETHLGQIGIECVFPLWGKDSGALTREFINDGFRAVVTSVDSEALDVSFAGREYDLDFLSDLPGGVDPCGENGEFHTFVYDGPIFKHAIGFDKGDITLTDRRFYVCDLLPHSLYV